MDKKFHPEIEAMRAADVEKLRGHHVFDQINPGVLLLMRERQYPGAR
jgi:hypothetical protein